GLGAFGDPGVFGVFGFASRSIDKARGAGVFVVAAAADGFELAEGEAAGGEGAELEAERSVEDLGELFEAGAGGGAVEGLGGKVPEDGDELAAAESPGAELIVDLVADGIFHLAFL